jgi:hypothetical protein
VNRKKGIETVVAAFTDHLAVMLRLSMDSPIWLRGRGAWRLNSSLLNEQHVLETFKQQWTLWKRQQHLFPNVNLWWWRYCKRRLRQVFQRAEEERRRDFRNMGNFYYE